MFEVAVPHTGIVIGSRPVVVALHCSGGSGRQWRHLARALGPRFNMVAPDLIGCGARAHWSGEHPFTLADEAAGIVALMDGAAAPVHLVGHSYGGGVALRAAVERPHRVASLSLYEPTAFHVLRSMGPDPALREIQAIADEVGRAVAAGAYRSAAVRFVDYWNGKGAFAALDREGQASLVRYIPKAVLDFRALIGERTPLVAYRRLRMPLRILCGEHSPNPAILVARRLASVMNPGAIRVVGGAGHMGPFSHADMVARELADHIAASEGLIERTGEMRAA
jgi:pimeloyl-ACP methyl ester carboxylesterase